MKPLAITTAITLATLVFGTGCEDRKSTDVCRSNCQLTVSLPEDVSKPPEISNERMRLAGGGELDIRVEVGSAENHATELHFFRPGQHADSGTPFVDKNDRPIYRVLLDVGSNRLKLRPYDDNVCRPPDGCKYDIVNTGNTERPTKDPWIILE